MIDDDSRSPTEDRRFALLTSVVAHDLANLLFAVRGSLETLAMIGEARAPAPSHSDGGPSSDVPPSGVAERTRARVDEALERSTALARALLARAAATARIDRAGPIDLAEPVRRAVEASRSRGAEVALEVPDAPARVAADASWVEALVEVLLRNAEDAVAERAEAKSDAGEGPLAAAPIRVSVESIDEPPGVAIRVRDDGAGLSSDEARLRAFEPFYTTREGRPGLGLAIARGIVRAHDGGIRLDAEREGPDAPGGTTVVVTLPIG